MLALLLVVVGMCHAYTEDIKCRKVINGNRQVNKKKKKKKKKKTKKNSLFADYQM
jgi:hypothetical protein